METVFNRLTDANRSWRIYFHDIPQSATLARIWAQLPDHLYLFEEHFMADAMAGCLPSCSFIEPRYFACPAVNRPPNDQHPPHDVMLGERLIARCYDAIRQGRGWERTLFIITYDEHGGLYDHVAPPAATSPDSCDQDGFTFNRYGVRVPAVLISPWIPAGTVLRLGPIGDETLIARPLGLLRMTNAASADYLALHGVPRSLEDLQRQEHRTIHFSTTLGARPHGWEYPDGDGYGTLQLPTALHVNSAQTYEAAALAGLGLIQAPLLGIGPYLESGALVEIPPDFRRRPLAVSLVVAHRSNLSRRVRAFMKWIEGVLSPYLE